MTYENLGMQFSWLGDGAKVESMIRKNLVTELGNFKRYLRSLDQSGLNEIIDDADAEADKYWFESGDTYKWVGVLQAADLHWGSADEPCMIRAEDEKPRGDSPQILFKLRDRLEK